MVSIAPDVCLTPIGSSMVPVPYGLIAYQNIDPANMANSVRQTSLVSHVKSSLITKSFGDEPGTGGGVKSGTTGAECEPKTYSSTVYAEGRNMVRFDDEWWMNHKNTVGRLIYTDDLNQYPGPPESNTQYASLLWPEVKQATAGNADQPPIQLAQMAPPIAGPLGGLGRFGPMFETIPRTGPTDVVPPMPFRDLTDEQIENKLDEKLRPKEMTTQPEPDKTPKPEKGEGPLPVPPFTDGNRTSKRCPSRRICFNRKNYDRQEYNRQLQLQQDAINAKSPAQNVTDIDNYSPSLRQIARPAQERAKSKYIQDYRDSFTQQYGPEAWDDHINSLAAIHRLDMVAGGNPTDIAGMGNKEINSSIGPSWNQAEVSGMFNPSRKEELRSYAAQMRDRGCPMQVSLSTCDGMEA
ncbi:hypothetical protein BJF91_15255 [Allorhizobium taibaishanense]|uniref:Novel toxin 15 domain-containing protein n=1 Tax=Allorhizobium taibaishanense TaxID=887144 RepID=A0A1Q9AC08_9HYPH|nr:hypothetical protein BJF91_15255 [Allorhizobium taibaishanense]